jgi:7,8-dihydropterin-6-yl-methyl-4-(beta-D-ribofuranosyl)aminobenzene 5'-phosphate synthase
MVILSDGSSFDLPPPERMALEEAGYQIMEKEDASLLLDGAVLISGQIERTTDFEKGFPVHYAEVGGKLEKDPLILDDQALIMNLKGRGLVVLTACGHAGLINTIRYAQRITGNEEVYAVMGGMHLTGGLFEPVIPRTISELKSINPSLAIPCHCTGWKAIHEVARHLPHAFVQNSVGTKYILSA